MTIRSSFCTIAMQQNKWGRDRTVERPLVEVLPIVAEAGFDGVEIWGPHLDALGEGALDDVNRTLRETGLDVAMVSPYFNFTKSEEAAEESRALGMRTIELARLVGSRGIRCFTGHDGSAEANEAQWHRAVEGLQTLADAGPDLLFALETHSRMLMDTVETARRLVERIGRPNVRLILQPSTFAPAWLEATEALADLSVHVHASNSRSGERSGLEDGDMDWPLILRTLAGRGFDGYVSVEWMGPDPDEAARREGAFLRRVIDGL